MFDAAVDPAAAGMGVAGQRAGALERVRYALADLARVRVELDEVEARMVSPGGCQIVCVRGDPVGDLKEIDCDREQGIGFW